MATEIYLTLPGFTGESNKQGAVGKIEITSMSFGISNQTSAPIGGGQGTGKAELHPITLTKTVDSASPAIFKNAAAGNHIATGQIMVRETTGGATTEPYYTLDLTKVTIESVTFGAASMTSGRITETIVLSCGSIKTTYFQQDSTSGSLTNKGSATYDVTTNTVS